MDRTVQEIYGNRVRVRTCGLYQQDNQLLLVNHHGLYNRDFWAPPGGGLEFGQSATSNLEREFLEETGLTVKAGEFLFACEFIQPPLHAIELFFDVIAAKGSHQVGKDPEMGTNEQIIRQVKYFSDSEINDILETHKHGLFRVAKSIEKIRALRGYLNI